MQDNEFDTAMRIARLEGHVHNAIPTLGERVTRLETDTNARFGQIMQNIDDMKHDFGTKLDFIMQRLSRDEGARISNKVWLGLVGAIAVSAIGTFTTIAFRAITEHPVVMQHEAKIFSTQE